MRLIHLTDPHLTSLADQTLCSVRGKRRLGYLSWQRKRRFRHRPEILARVTEAVLQESPAQIVISGDLAQVGLPAEIRAARAWLESLGPPDRVALVPGNHDFYQADSWPAIYRNWGDYLGLAGQGWAPGAGSQQPAEFPWERHLEGPAGGVTLIGLCSAYAAPLLMADGRIGVDQLARLETAFCRARGLRCVLLHHPPLPGMAAWRKALRDARRLGALLERHQPELVLHGHVHRNHAGPVVGTTRIFATASASSAQPGVPASYRVFDIRAAEARPGEGRGRSPGPGWTVFMQLKGLTPDGQVHMLEEDRWFLPFRQLASAP